MVALLKSQMQSYSNDDLLNILVDENNSPEIIQTAQSIIFERGIVQQENFNNFIAHIKARREAYELISSGIPDSEVFDQIRNDFGLDDEHAQAIMDEVKISQENIPSFKMLNFVMVGMMFYFSFRIIYTLI